MRIHVKIFKSFFLILFCLGLTSCGFHLRGQTPLPTELSNLYLESDSPYSQFMIQLRQVLSHMGSTLVKNPADANVTLKITGQHFETTTFSQSASATTTQYTLKYFYTYQLLDKSGASDYGPKTLSLEENYTVNQDSVLSSGNETSLVKEELQRNAVYQLVEQLNSKDVRFALEHPKTPLDNTPSTPIVSKNTQ